MGVQPFRTVRVIPERAPVKKRILVAIVVVMVLAVAACRVPAYDPEIRDWHDLHAVRHHLDKSFVLMNDLDSSTAGYEELAGPGANDGRGWEPIGDSRRPFRGTLDGQGYHISDLYINRPTETHVGLLGFVAEEGTISCVRLTGVDVTGHGHVGGVVGTNHGEVEDCSSTGYVRGAGYTGGLVGVNRGSVSRSYSAGSVNPDTHFFSALSLPPGSAVGGLIGWSKGSVSDSYSTAHVSGLPGCGLVGTNLGIISKAYATGSVYGDRGGYGLVKGSSGMVSDSFWDVETSGTEQSGEGTGKTTAEMMDIATFSDTATDGLEEPWDIIAVDPGERNEAYIWNIVDGETYPFLSWEPVS